MEYVNTKTGATISSPCKISGGDWVEVGTVPRKNPIAQLDIPEHTHILPVESIEAENQKASIKSEEQQGNEENDDSFVNDEAYNSITKNQIKQELDAFGIEYDPKAKKPDLYKLMLSQGK